MNSIIDLKKRILITGANGLLGQSLINLLSNKENVKLLATSIENEYVDKAKDIQYESLDITNKTELKKLFLDFLPNIVINAAAYTNVDNSEIYKEQCWKLNVEAVKHLVNNCRIIDSKIVSISSDFIFDGKNGPYSEVDKVNPISYYGRTKLASENEIKLGGAEYLIIRTNVLYGRQKGDKKDFVDWVRENLLAKRQINVVTDQINNPTYSDDLAQGIWKALEFKKTGIYNLGGIEIINRYEFAKMIAEFFQLDISYINKTTTDKLNQRAKRPLSSGLLILKAQSEFQYSPHSIIENLTDIKHYIETENNKK